MAGHDTVRPPAVAGAFYPADSQVLERAVQDLIEENRQSIDGRLRALIVPHAGYRYSGPVAGSAYSLLVASNVIRFVMVGPSHFVSFPGVALPGHDRLETPLGPVGVDQDLLEPALELDLVARSVEAHRREHSLEVQWPFLQVAVRRDVELLPVLTGDLDPTVAGAVIETVLDRYPSAMIIVSSDLSHYLTHREAVLADRKTAELITQLDGAGLPPRSACGLVGIRALVSVAAKRGWACRLLDARTSADTVGGPQRVVGYGAFCFTD